MNLCEEREEGNVWIYLVVACGKGSEACVMLSLAVAYLVSLLVLIHVDVSDCVYY